MKIERKKLEDNSNNRKYNKWQGNQYSSQCITWSRKKDIKKNWQIILFIPSHWILKKNQNKMSMKGQILMGSFKFCSMYICLAVFRRRVCLKIHAS